MKHDYISHGTQAFTLAPSSIVGTAMRDLAKRRYNIALAAWRDSGDLRNPEHPGEPDKFHRYAFKADDVRPAIGVADLLRRALKRAHALARQPEVCFALRSHQLLYGDPVALQYALDAVAVAQPDTQT